MNAETMITLREAAGVLKKHYNTALAMAQKGQFPGAVRVGRAWRVNLAILNAYCRGEVQCPAQIEQEVSR